MSETITKFLKSNPYRAILIFTIPSVLLLVVLISGFISQGSQQFSDLAKAFLHGHLNFLAPIGGLGQDPVLWHGKIYWDDGPFPAILLIPFVGVFALVHLFFYQGYLMWLLVISVFFMVFRLARSLSYSKEDSLILAFGFTLGSVFIGVAAQASSWFFAQVVTTFLLFWSLYEYFIPRPTHRRWWLIGILCGLILMTRATAAPIILFFGLELWQTAKITHEKIIRSLQLVVPVIGTVLVLGLYNFLRFHNPFNGGFSHQLLFKDSAESRAYGIFSIVHIPTNFYYAVLTAPMPVLRNDGSWTLKFPFIANNLYGMSIFVTSPYFFYLFMQKWRSFDTRCRHLIIATLVVCLFVFSYYGVGLLQFGYRYSLDFLPELFLLFMIMYRKNHRVLSRGMKTLLLGAGVFNFYLLWTFLQ